MEVLRNFEPCEHCETKKQLELLQKINMQKTKLIEQMENDFNIIIGVVRQTLEENLHLCDGDDCTLKDLRDAYIGLSIFCTGKEKAKRDMFMVVLSKES